MPDNAFGAFEGAGRYRLVTWDSVTRDFGPILHVEASSERELCAECRRVPSGRYEVYVEKETRNCPVTAAN